MIRILVPFLLLFSANLSKACTDSVASFPNNGSITFKGVQYNYPTTGKSTWYYTVVSSNAGNAWSHIVFNLNKCYSASTFLDVGTWTSFTSLTSKSSNWVFGKDPSTGYYGIKSNFGSWGKPQTMNVYFTLGANYAVGLDTAVAKPGSSVVYDLVCGPTSTCGALPVKLIAFDVQKISGQAVLNWVTASEINNSHFEIERSQDLVHWNQIGRVEGNGNSQITRRYTYTDHQPSVGQNYYRLKQVDFDGGFEYSRITKLTEVWTNENVHVYPNPSNGKINVSVNSGDHGETIHVSVNDIAGRLLLEKNYPFTDKTRFNAQLNIDELENGLYCVVVSDGINSRSYRIIKSN